MNKLSISLLMLCTIYGSSIQAWLFNNNPAIIKIINNSKLIPTITISSSEASHRIKNFEPSRNTTMIVETVNQKSGMQEWTEVKRERNLTQKPIKLGFDKIITVKAGNYSSVIKRNSENPKAITITTTDNRYNSSTIKKLEQPKSKLTLTIEDDGQVLLN